MPQARFIKIFHKRLQEWYAAQGRHGLPWRNTTDSYAIYISEVMLQQTQVKTVLERFYAPFLAKFPTLQTLADAPRDEVMKAWEGLGYYSRAANLHEAAKRAAPLLPSTAEELESLPGIGRNTAHAIAAFAHHAPVPVMEANVKRVLCRIFVLKTPKTDELWEKALLLLDRQNPFDYNQAMMDIGAMVCTKRAPKCLECPAFIICKGKAAPELYPEKMAKKAVPIRKSLAIVLQDNLGRMYVAKRDGAFLNGLYGFPLYPLDTEQIYIENHKIDLKLAQEIGGETQIYSHFRSDVHILHITLNFEGAGEGWFHPAALKGIALSGIDHKIHQKTSDFLRNCQKTFTIRRDNPAL